MNLARVDRYIFPFERSSPTQQIFPPSILSHTRFPVALILEICSVKIRITTVNLHLRKSVNDTFYFIGEIVNKISLLVVINTL